MSRYIPGCIPVNTLRAIKEIRSELFAKITTVVPPFKTKVVGHTTVPSRMVWTHIYHSNGGDGCITPKEIGPFAYRQAIYDVKRAGLSIEQYRAIRALAGCPECPAPVTLHLEPPMPTRRDSRWMCPWCRALKNVKLTNLGREKVQVEVKEYEGFETQKELLTHLRSHCQDRRDIPFVVNQRVTTSQADWQRQVVSHSKPTIHNSDVAGKFSESDFNPYYCSGMAPVRISKQFTGIKDLSNTARERERSDMPENWNHSTKLVGNQAEYDRVQRLFPTSIMPDQPAFVRKEKFGSQQDLAHPRLVAEHSGFVEGSLVYHIRYGNGKVVALELIPLRVGRKFIPKQKITPFKEARTYGLPESRSQTGELEFTLFLSVEFENGSTKRLEYDPTYIKRERRC